MNPIYKFELATEYNGVTNNYAVYPLRKADLAKEYELQQNEMFYRAKLAGKLLFTRADYAIIANARFETKFTLIISISWNNGKIWTEYWRGRFWKTDCRFDADAKTVEVTPMVVDEYNDVLAGIEKEYNLIDLKPEIVNLTLTKRPLIQMYIPGESVVSCFLSGMSWEQECKVVTDDNELREKYSFALNKTLPGAQRVTGTEYGSGMWYDGYSASGNYKWTYETKQETEGEGETQTTETYVYTYLTRVRGSERLYANRNLHVAATGNFTLYEYGDETRTPIATVEDYGIRVYARYLLDADQYRGQPTYNIPADDIVANNSNYRYARGYAVSDVVYFSSQVTYAHTEWGRRPDGYYWVKPTASVASGIQDFYPIGRSHWEQYSIWFTFSSVDRTAEIAGRKDFTLKDAYPLHSVISVLLSKIAPGITHEQTVEYSQFLYDTHNPISTWAFDLYITPKSNVLAGNYSEPAMKAPITLKTITDMLRDVYRCYWYVENGKFKIEHIQWFKNGGRYYGTPNISHDLTIEKVTRNGKAWAFATSQFEYDKESMPERYQFSWMDDVTQVFEGSPIDIVSKYVTPGNIKQITISNFTTDVDYMLTNPAGCSKDGYALLATVKGYNVVPIVERIYNNVVYFSQNGLLTLTEIIPLFYIYDLPAYSVRINNTPYIAYGITREKKQTLRMPIVDDPNPTQLIKTFLGNGQVEKISVNLSSRNANVTLMYDTQNYDE